MFIIFLGVALLITAIGFGWFLAQELQPRVASPAEAPAVEPQVHDDGGGANVAPSPKSVVTPVRRHISIKPYEPPAPAAPVAVETPAVEPIAEPEVGIQPEPETITLTLVRKPVRVAAALEPPEAIDYDGPPAAVEPMAPPEPEVAVAAMTPPETPAEAEALALAEAEIGGAAEIHAAAASVAEAEPAAPRRPRWSGPGRRFRPRAFAPLPFACAKGPSLCVRKGAHTTRFSPPPQASPTVVAPAVSLGLNIGTTHLTWCVDGAASGRLPALVAFPDEGPPVVGEAARALLDTAVVCQPFHKNLLATARRPADKRDLRRAATELLLDEVIRRAQERGGDGPLRLALTAAPGVWRLLDPMLTAACRERSAAMAVLSEPYAIARAEGASRGAVVISIGAVHTEVTAVLARPPRPEDSTLIRCGGADVDARLVDLLKDRPEAPRLDAERARAFKEAHGRIRSRAGGVLVRLSVDGGEAELDIGDELQRACGQLLVGLRPALRRVVEQLEPQERLAIKDQIIVVGGSAAIDGICEALQPILRELSAGSARRAQDHQGAAAQGALEIARALPEQRWAEALAA